MKTVLIADDEPLFLASLTEGLAVFNTEFVVVTAENGRAAAGVLDSRHVDLVVTDLKMPVMDGFELLAYLTRRHPLIPAIVMTAFGTPAIEDQLRELDAYGYLEKPIDFQVLTDKVRAGLAISSLGHIQGITLFSFLQLLHVEQKTCSLRITSHGRQGYLYLVEGDVVDAAVDDLDGERAAHEIVCWADAQIEIVDLFKKVKRRIETSLPNLLMDAAQIIDEAGRSDPGDSLLSDLDFSDSDEGNEERTSIPAPRKSIREDSEDSLMGNVTQSLEQLMQIDGAMAVALVDNQSGMSLGSQGGGLNLDVAAAGNSEVIRAKHKVMQNLGLKDQIEDILISLGGQYHLIRPVGNAQNLFIYLVLNRTQANLAMARHKLTSVESQLQV